MTEDPQRDAVIDALIPQIPFEGWTMKALRHALISLGEPPEDAPLLFPNGPGEMIEAFFALADRRMEEEAANTELSARIPDRIRAIIALRLAQNRGSKEAIRRAFSWLALPMHAPRALRITAATADAIWHAAGDGATDFSWYTKRTSLAAIYSATMLYWLRDISDDDEATLAFLDRRLAGIGRITSLRRRAEARLNGLRDKARSFTGRKPAE